VRSAAGRAAGKLEGVQWSPRAGETAALAAIGLGLALGVLVVDAAGRLLLGAAALLVLALVVRDVVLRPRLSAGPDGVAVRTLGGVQRLPWAELTVQVRATRRWGVRSRLLELDTATGPDDTGTLMLLGRRDLGTDPDAVARALRDLHLAAG
jgi:Bacterial PH domain